MNKSINSKQARYLDKVLAIVAQGALQVEECGALTHTSVYRAVDMDAYGSPWMSDKELLSEARKDAYKLEKLDEVAKLPELTNWDVSTEEMQKEEDSYLWEQEYVDGFEFDVMVEWESERPSRARAWVAGVNQRVDMEWSSRVTKAIFDLMDPEGTGVAQKPMSFSGTAYLDRSGMMVPYPLKHTSVIQSLMWLSGSRKQGKPGFVSDPRFTYEDRGALFTFLRGSWDHVKSMR